MAQVKYTGDADVRRISKDDLKTNQEYDASFDGDVLEWNKKNKFTVEVSDADAAKLAEIDRNLSIVGEGDEDEVGESSMQSSGFGAQTMTDDESVTTPGL